MKWIIWRYFSFFFCLSFFFLSITVYLLFSFSSVTSVSANNRRASLCGSTNSRWNAQAEPASPVRYLCVTWPTGTRAHWSSCHVTWQGEGPPSRDGPWRSNIMSPLQEEKNLKRRQTTFSEQTLLFLWHFIFPFSFPSRFSPCVCVLHPYFTRVSRCLKEGVFAIKLFSPRSLLQCVVVCNSFF